MDGHWTVGEVAKMAHVTVRTLHHYDEIGLLTPADRSPAGYRSYDAADLERLRSILLYRELGFALEAIAGLLDVPAPEQATALRAQRELLGRKVRRLESVARAVDRTLEAMEKGEPMSTDELFEGFESWDAPDEVKSQQAEHGAEARGRWGETDAYRQSMRRARGYRKEDWARIRAEQEAIEADMAGLLAAGADPEGEEAMAAAERHRRHISASFYDCAPGMHAGLADMYEADARFRAHYEERAEGLAAFVAAAIRANARRTEGGSGAP